MNFFFQNFSMHAHVQVRVSFSKKPTGRTKDELHFYALVTAYVHKDGPEVDTDRREVDSGGGAPDAYREKRTCVRC